ncbi:zinc-binding dehydrogenase [Streptomyces glaucescens]|uniref:Dehydrogenase n=1 Tax=Streptomyces glaucescens TaxID=1907 RepID=A0A089XB49_STRGA|nr:zinc-binding dehydrogenase [Streptomyces glaucescens]AIR99141.1 dehydrogenase [Streptomyces glaucescens]
MLTAQVKEFGGPEVLVPVTVPDPEPGPGEVLIEVSHADTIFLETQLRAGWGGEYFTVTPPYVPGGGVAGTVRAIGAGTGARWLGRRVAAFVDGSYAERALAPADALTPVPEGLDLPAAAALVHDGVTAMGLLERIALTAGDRVLILGASGGMGTLLVQLAHARGARVVAAARGDRKRALVRRLGADETVDVTTADWPEQARAALGGAADVVLDGVGGPLGAAALPLTAPGGRFSAHGAPTGAFADLDRADATRRGVTLYGIADAQYTADEVVRLRTAAFAAAAAGRLTPVIGQRVPLAEAARAHRLIEGREVVGKVVLEAAR